ncbi:HNH endonuclease signature motif containing protein [Nocardioides plantarum]|uniref:DUF222 domain-containing protein n=1 Tax=Nocardioides plantarum TaxID=29299 RepID=A0ABV5K5Q2_9ACTN|nr:HNH endonuclease signature motif containing protein [Nocardioides plantarum]
MTKHQDPTRSGHPIESFLCSALDDLEGLADVPAWSMDEATTDRVVLLAARVAAGVAEVEARAIGQAVSLDRPGIAGCRGVTQWLRQLTNVTGRLAARKAALASSLAAWEPTRAATARGAIHAEQAQAIADKIALLDDDVTDHDKQRAEAFLLGEAADHDADALGRMGHEIYARLDPDCADAREAEALARAEARARKRTRLRMYDDGEGLTHGTFVIPTLYGEMLRKALAALAAPKHVRAEQGAGSYDWETPTPEKLGKALCDYVARFPASKLPKLGGLNATVIAIGDADLLEGKVKVARLDTGHKISHLDYLRLACEAGIIPIWMNATGDVVSMGRRHRFHTARQRLALIARHQHCQRNGCTVPGYLCHVHHPHPWSEGGETSLRNAELLCPFHHGVAHAGHAVEAYPMRT